MFRLFYRAHYTKVFKKTSLKQFSELTNNLFDQDRVLKSPWSAGSCSIDSFDSN